MFLKSFKKAMQQYNHTISEKFNIDSDVLDKELCDMFDKIDISSDDEPFQKFKRCENGKRVGSVSSVSSSVLSLSDDDTVLVCKKDDGDTKDKKSMSIESDDDSDDSDSDDDTKDKKSREDRDSDDSDSDDDVKDTKTKDDSDDDSDDSDSDDDSKDKKPMSDDSDSDSDDDTKDMKTKDESDDDSDDSDSDDDTKDKKSKDDSDDDSDDDTKETDSKEDMNVDDSDDESNRGSRKRKREPKIVQDLTPETVDTCPYVITKGEKKGNFCGSKPRNGMTYCSKHKKYEECPQKPKKVLPKVSESSRPSLRRIDGTLVHKTTGLMFNDKKEVYSHQDGRLTDEHIELCKTWKFKVCKDSLP